MSISSNLESYQILSLASELFGVLLYLYVCKKCGVSKGGLDTMKSKFIKRIWKKFRSWHFYRWLRTTDLQGLYEVRAELRQVVGQVAREIVDREAAERAAKEDKQ